MLVTFRRGVAKMYSELVALRLLYTVKPITKLKKKVESGWFSQSGSHTYVCMYVPHVCRPL